jgi:lactate dehydrogenase-like 2-hydroxyacid dehydrogenase
MSQNPPEHAIVDEDDEDEVEVKLKDGYISGTASDVDEEETADEIIMKELDRRGAKEG